MLVVGFGLQVVAYDRRRNALFPAMGDAFNTWFPEPPGMEALRQSDRAFGLDELTRRKQLMDIETK